MSGAVSSLELQHFGFEAEYYHERSSELELPRAIVDQYENRKERAAIFIHTESGRPYTTVEILDWRLKARGVTLKELLPAVGANKFATIPLSFDEGQFHMQTDAGATGLRTLKLLVGVRSA